LPPPGPAFLYDRGRFPTANSVQPITFSSVLPFKPPSCAFFAGPVQVRRLKENFQGPRLERGPPSFKLLKILCRLFRPPPPPWPRTLVQFIVPGCCSFRPAPPRFTIISYERSPSCFSLFRFCVSAAPPTVFAASVKSWGLHRLMSPGNKTKSVALTSPRAILAHPHFANGYFLFFQGDGPPEMIYLGLCSFCFMSAAQFFSSCFFLHYCRLYSGLMGSLMSRLTSSNGWFRSSSFFSFEPPFFLFLRSFAFFQKIMFLFSPPF